MPEPLFVLKSTPPRAPRTMLMRKRMASLWTEIRDATAILVCAPGGFGKTTLLTQWRRLWLEQRALVAWVSLDAQDDPDRFPKLLLYAMRVASGRPVFDTIATQYAGQSDRQFDALTGLLSEIALLATQTVLILDDAERLPETTTRESLTYLLFNAPPNLRVVIGSRTPLPLPTADLVAKGGLATLKASDLRFRLDESVELLHQRFGARLGLDDCVRLHEITEGWPIGLQLAAASIEREPDLHRAVESISARRGDIERYFLESLFSHLPAALGGFLTRVAILDALAPDLCAAVTGCADAAACLDQLRRDTPILIVGEGEDWMRLHPLARDFLLGQFERLPPPERRELQLRAAHWYAQREMYHEAARHALAAGDNALAESYAERCLWFLVTQGKLGEAREWLDRLSGEAIAKDVHLRLAAGWVMALGDRPTEAERIAEKIACDPTATKEIRCEADLIIACAAAFTDRPQRIIGILGPWEREPLPVHDPVLAIAYANSLAFVALHQGATDKARQLEANLTVDTADASLLLVLGLGRFIVGLSYLWDGNALAAEAALRPALESAERKSGRRSLLSAMFASALAAAMLERDQPAVADALLAHRLDVVERTGIQDAILAAHRTLAGVALAQGDERRALDVFENLHALGESRRWPRLAMHSLAEQIRVHALASRNETAMRLVDELDGMAPVFAHDDLQLFEPLFRLHAAIAKTYAALARDDLTTAERNLKLADALAARLHRGRATLAVKVLRAVVAHQRGSPQALPLLAEAQSLAALGGLDRLLADVHPRALTMARALAATAASGQTAAAAERPAETSRPRPVEARRPMIPLGGLLTPKEAEVLQLLTAGMSNKHIANTLDISDETVKWHLKNLFSKLSAGTRKHAVDRARLLGLLAA